MCQSKGFRGLVLRVLFPVLGLVPVMDGAAEPASAESATQVAEPRPYQPLPAAKLGTNEQGFGLEPGGQVESVAVTDMQGNNYPLARAWRQRPDIDQLLMLVGEYLPD